MRMYGDDESHQTYNPIDELADVRRQLDFLSSSCSAVAEQLGIPPMMHPGDALVALAKQLKQLSIRVDRAQDEAEKAIRATAGA